MKKEVSNFMTYEFDHLVIISRDRMEEISDTFHSLGFALTPLSKHNLGSSNRLAILDSCYLEILGWEADSIPIRKEIADEPCGLNALVFRTVNADTCYQNLKDNGFDWGYGSIFVSTSHQNTFGKRLIWFIQMK